MGKPQLIESSRDPARAALGAAIRERDMRARDSEAAKAAVERANTLVDVAETRHGLAKAGLAAWRINQVERLHAAAATGEAPAQESAREARAAAQDAADEIESAKSVLVDCEARARDAKDESEWATRNVESLVGPVLTNEIDRLVTEAARLRDELHRKHAVLVWLRDLLPFGGEQRQRVSAILPPPSPPGVREVDYRPPAEWVAARDALRQSAEAPLPSTP
jgi:hypothetical protein